MYCSECGTPHEYVGKKPNFCTNCGFSFSGLKKSSVANLEESEESEEIIEEIPEIDGLQVEIEPYGNSGVKIEDAVAMGAQEGGTPEKTKRQKGKRLTKKSREEFLNNWQKEAGTSRNRNE